MLAFLHHTNLLQLSETLGYIGLTTIIFVETGLFIGFFLPGDSLLFTAGLLATQGFFNIFILLLLLLSAAILGYIVAYFIGLKLGYWLLKRRDRLWFKKRYLEEAKLFYSQHGGKALILGRLLPVVRTFVPIVAGMADLSFTKYCFYNVCGALFWVGGLVMLGYTVGQAFPDAYEYIYPLILIIIVISLLPTLWHIWLARRNKLKNVT